MNINRPKNAVSPADNRATVVVAAAQGVQLRILNGPEAGRLIPATEFPCRLGRGDNCRVVLADPDDPPALSREHATLSRPRRHAGEIVVTDHSRNGTCVGGQWLASGEAELLMPGETLQLGPTLRLLREHASGPTYPATVMVPEQKAQDLPPPVPADLRAFLTMPETLQAAWRRVALNRGAAGPDNVTLQEFAQTADRRLTVLRSDLMRGRYQPLPPRLFAAPKRSGGVRAIAILSIQDRIVQQALHSALQPHLERFFPPCSYAYRPGVCAHHALRRVDTLLREGQTWVAETDIAGFFDTIQHTLLLEKLTARIPDPFLLSLVARCLAVGARAPGIGIAQGAATSPLFSNLYLAEFDAAMLAGGWNPVRYGDDLLFPVRERHRARAALAEAEGFLRSRLHLTVKPEKTGVVCLAQGFTFLGFHFTEAGRQAAPQAVAQLTERLQAATPEAAPAIVRGWKNYFGAEPDSVMPQTIIEEHIPPTPQAASDYDDQPPRPDAIPLVSSAFAALDAADIARFLALFGGREDLIARQSGQGSRPRFTASHESLSPESVRRHLAGLETLATYLVRLDGTVRHLVFDMDIAQPPGRPAAQETEDREGIQDVKAFAEDIYRVCRSLGLPACLEDSGRRGRHLWIFFSEGVAPERARRLARLLSLRAGFPRDGVRLEIFPRHTDWPGPELGDAVKLPFGVHPATGRRCFFLDASGEPIPDPAAALERIRTVSPAEVEGLITVLSQLETAGATEQNLPPRKDTVPPSAVDKLVSGCSVIRTLVQRAQQTGHLRHTHQLILLYTAGRLGPEGAAFLHRTIANCRNYDAGICQGYIDRLEQNHPPLGCRRIREWLEEEGESALCTCPAARRTPLELTTTETVEDALAAKLKKPRSPRAQACQTPLPTEVHSALWQEVADDLFAEETVETVLPSPDPDEACLSHAQDDGLFLPDDFNAQATEATEPQKELDL